MKKHEFDEGVTKPKFQDPLHLSMLRTIYRQLTSTTVDCPRYGSMTNELK